MTETERRSLGGLAMHPRTRQIVVITDSEAQWEGVVEWLNQAFPHAEPVRARSIQEALSYDLGNWAVMYDAQMQEPMEDERMLHRAVVEAGGHLMIYGVPRLHIVPVGRTDIGAALLRELEP